MESMIKPRLLVVDDEDGPRKSLQIIFKNRYQVEMASGGREALEIVKKNPVQVAILDIRMPDMDGIETLQALKENDPDIEVLMLTAYETLETARQALRLGARDYLNKPFDLAVVEESVKRAFERRAASDRARSSLSELKELEEALYEQRVKVEMAREKDEIYASVLHDINGPLSIISAFAQMTYSSIKNLDSVNESQIENIRRNLERMNQQAERCITLSKRYLGFLRESTGQSSPVPMNVMIEDIRELLRNHPSTKGQELEIYPTQEETAPSMNGTDLIQVLLNLIINALQATTEPHRVEVKVERVREVPDLSLVADTAECRVLNREGFKKADSSYTITVSDNGPGIPESVLDQMFDSYFTTKGDRGGTGLGLSIVQRLIKNTGVGLLLQTKVGMGTAFTLYIPLA